MRPDLDFRSQDPSDCDGGSHPASTTVQRIRVRLQGTRELDTIQLSLRAHRSKRKSDIFTQIIIVPFKVGPTRAPTHFPTSALTCYFLVKNATFSFG
jgi:hypothetical protein